MSSNIANLKKSKKAPFQHGQPKGNSQRIVPFPDVGSVNESDLLEEVTMGLAKNRINESSQSVSLKMSSLPKVKDAVPRIANLNTTPSALPNDHELLTSMMSRLTQLEQRLQSQTKEIIEKDKKIKILQEKVSILNKAREESSPSHVQELEKKCLLLQQQVHEMESFLQDYGMEWLGDQTESESETYLQTEEEVWRPATSLHSFEVNFDLINKNVEDLNVLAGEGLCKIQHTVDGARLRMQDPIPLTLYSNGIIMFSGPFRSYDDPTTQRCIQDIQDGYFPSELQKRYPDGVPIKLTDKRDVFFKDNRHDIFKGSGQMLGGETKPSSLVTTNLGKSEKKDKKPSGGGLNEECELPGPRLTVQQLLSKLPTSVVKGGNVINIRDSIKDHLKGGTLAEIQVSDLQGNEGKQSTEVSKQVLSSKNTTTLRIKSEAGEHTYVVRMDASNTIADLRNFLDRHRGSTCAVDYDIMSSFPSRVFHDCSATLLDCGLVPNAALHLKAKMKK